MFKQIFLRKFIALIVFIAMLSVISPLHVFAASVTSFSVLLSREKAATLTNMTITFTVPAGIDADETIILTFDNSTSIPVALDYTDIDLKDDAAELTLAAAPGASNWGVVRTSSTVITFTNGDIPIGSSSVIEIQIGTHATSGATGDQQITNGSAGTTTLSLSGTMGNPDMIGTAAMSIIADDQVVITATVAPTMTFTISDNTIEFGALSASQATWADNAGGSSTDVAAHTLTMATNGTEGYAIYYNGATLTSGSDTINTASVTNDANGTPGTEQFGLSVEPSGGGIIATGYDYGGTPDWKWETGSTVFLIQQIGPVSTETFNMHYLANISTTTEAGAYSTTATYTATATF